MLAAACSCVVSKSRCWRPWPAYAPVTFADEPSPASCVSIRTLPRAEPKPSATQSSEPSRSTTARWVPNTHDFSFSAWPETNRRWALGPTTSSTTVLNSPSTSSSAERYCSHTSACGALLEDDEHPPVERVPCPDRLAGEQDRFELHPSRHVDEVPVAQRGLVAGDEGVVGGDRGPEVALDQLGMLPARASSSGMTIASPASRRRVVDHPSNPTRDGSGLAARRSRRAGRRRCRASTGR